jgi:AcrR family transcriptional regulator
MGDKKSDIYRCGKAVFGAKGFKDTKVSDIAEKAGVAVGTFYNFYSSKEELFLAIYTEENDKVKKIIMETVDFDADPIQVVKQALAINFKEMQSNPILKEWYNRDVFHRIEHYYRAENEKNDAVNLRDALSVMVEKWQLDGKIRGDIDFEMILALFHVITYIDTQKEAIGIRFFPRITDYLAEFIMKGLTDRSTI